MSQKGLNKTNQPTKSTRQVTSSLRLKMLFNKDKEITKNMRHSDLLKMLGTNIIPNRCLMVTYHGTIRKEKNLNKHKNMLVQIAVVDPNSDHTQLVDSQKPNNNNNNNNNTRKATKTTSDNWQQKKGPVNFFSNIYPTI